mgnify:CR=1 FL=1
MTKPIKTRKKITSVSRNFISVARTFFHTGRMCFGESHLFSSFMCYLLSRQYPSFCTAVSIGQKKFCIPKKGSVSMLHFSEYIQFSGQKSNV